MILLRAVKLTDKGPEKGAERFGTVTDAKIPAQQELQR
jgi:hypothetical protein